LRQVTPSVSTSTITTESPIIIKREGGGHEITTKSESFSYMGNRLVLTYHRYLNDHLWYAMIHGRATLMYRAITFTPSVWQQPFAKRIFV